MASLSWGGAPARPPGHALRLCGLDGSPLNPFEPGASVDADEPPTVCCDTVSKKKYIILVFCPWLLARAPNTLLIS